MKRIIIAAAMLATAAAHADEWTGRDKELHFVGGAAIAAAVTAATGNEWHGFLVSAGVGLAKEAYDSTGRGQVSGKDFAVTALGALIGAKATGWAIAPNRITYTMKF
jgi:uncharacterized protein YfiM (DUF2279 family)